MTIKATKQMTMGRAATGNFGFEVNGDVVSAVFEVEGKGHNVRLLLSRADILAEIERLKALVSPAPVAEPVPVVRLIDTSPTVETPTDAPVVAAPIYATPAAPAESFSVADTVVTV